MVQKSIIQSFVHSYLGHVQPRPQLQEISRGCPSTNSGSAFSSPYISKASTSVSPCRRNGLFQMAKSQVKAVETCHLIGLIEF